MILIGFIFGFMFGTTGLIFFLYHPVVMEYLRHRAHDKMLEEDEDDDE